MEYNLQTKVRDGKPIWLLECPKCKIWAYIDNDQFNGRVSVLCYCGFHKTVNFKKYLEETLFKEEK